MTACTTPQTPQGPRVSSTKGKRIYYPASQPESQSLAQGVPFEQSPLNSNNSNNTNNLNTSGVSFPNPSGTIPNDDQNTSGIVASVEPSQNNIPPNSIPSRVSAVETQPTQSVENDNNVSAPVPMGSAIQTLLADAKKAVAENRLDRASSSLERAVRIEPNNAGIWYDLAQIKLHQGQYTDAENLAKKSIGFAGEGTKMAKRNYVLISAIRKAQGDVTGAQEAENRSK